MMGKPARLCLAIGLALSLRTASAGEPLSFGILNVAPYGVERADGSVGGSNRDIADVIAAKAGFTFSYRLEPLPRLVSDLKAGKLDLMIMVPSEGLKDFALAELVSNDMVILPAPGRAFPQYEALRGMNIARLRGAIYDQRFVDDNEIHKHDVDSYVLGLRMTKAGRVDGMIGPDFGLYYQLKIDGMRRDEFGPPLVLSTRMLVLHRSPTLTPEVAARLKAAIEELRASGALAAATEPYVK
jgi:ABC-type amino acid transport substrate-binding protein